MNGRYARLTLSSCVLLLALSANSSGADLRVVSYNTQTLGDPAQALGSPARDQWDALVAVLLRLDADVVMLQEVAGSFEVELVPELSSQAGFSEWAVSDTSGTLSGGLRTACLSRFPLVPELTDSWSAAELSQSFGGTPLPEANDITRDIFHVGIDAGNSSPFLVFTVHMKSGSGNTNEFRRQVEIQRLLQAVSLMEVVSPGSPVILTGDFNEDPRDAPFTASWNAPPVGLPASYQLGSDITFPIVYSPFETLSAAMFGLLEANQEDSPGLVTTRPASGRRLDLIGARWEARSCSTLVYESCLDDGVNAPPLDHWLPMAGLPLECGVSEQAADHLPVIVDFRHWDALAGPTGIGDILRVHSHGDPEAARITAVLDWTADDLAGRPALDHFHVRRGVSADRLDLIPPHDHRELTWLDETDRGTTPSTVHFYRVMAADACDYEAR